MNNDDQQTPFAILYLPDAKAGQTVPVYGRSAKRYSFIPSPLVSGKPARVYHDPELFAREEGDIRRNLRPTAIISTSIGPANPAIRATAAVAALIESRQTLGAGAVREALLQIAERAKQALEEMDKTVAQDPKPVAVCTVCGEPATVATLGLTVAYCDAHKPEGVVVEALNGQQPPATTTKTTTTEPPKTTNEPIPVLNEPSLQTLEIEKLRDLAKKRGVAGRSRAEMVAGILKKQAEAA